MKMMYIIGSSLLLMIGIAILIKKITQKKLRKMDGANGIYIQDKKDPKNIIGKL
ncbi:MAG: hypothetical protein ACRCU3_10545 [Eubacteriaceae bacterium]